MPDLNIDDLLVPTGAFINTMYAVRDVLAFEPTKEHIATCINYADLQEMRDTFIRELKNMVNGFVYSATKQKAIVAALLEGRDLGAATTELHQRACDKFRTYDIKGQFSELLLCVLLQHYFRAAPLLRKMPITTNPAIERHGADAIHVGLKHDKPVIYLGEAKTFHRTVNSFRDSVLDCLFDVVEHYNSHRSELNLYTFEDFLSPELEDLAQRYQQGTATDVEVHLVCIATYHCERTLSGSSRQELLDSVISNIRADAESIKANKKLAQFPGKLMPRLNIILFCVRDLNDLIETFKKRFGHAT